MPKLLSNKVRCKRCGDVIESTYTHDFVACKCGLVFVDGGHEYARRGLLKVEGQMEDIEDLSEWAEEE